MMSVMWSDNDPEDLFTKVVHATSAELAISLVRTYCQVYSFPEPRWYFVAHATADQVARYETGNDSPAIPPRRPVLA